MANINTNKLRLHNSSMNDKSSFIFSMTTNINIYIMLDSFLTFYTSINVCKQETSKDIVRINGQFVVKRQYRTSIWMHANPQFIFHQNRFADNIIVINKSVLPVI